MLRNSAFHVASKFGGLFRDDTARFERFHNDEDNEDTIVMKQPCETTELSCLQRSGSMPNGLGNGAAGNHTPGCGGEDAYQSKDLCFALEDGADEDDLKSNRNRITAWQAGWNVTNAIQVVII
jgi:hypothetical protein